MVIMEHHNQGPVAPPRHSRRGVLKLTAAGAISIAATSLPGCSDKEGTSTDETPTGGSGPSTYPEPGPATIQSTAGVLKATLLVAPSMVAYRDRTRWALTVNGRTPGPVLRVRPGDRLELTLDNRSGHSTNLHTHGLRVSPSGNADNPFLEIPDGEKYEYRIEIPADHPGGTFWYHPHFHHHVAEQLFAGFFGPIVVEDDFDRLPEIAAATERFVLLHDAKVGSNETSVLSATPMEQREGRQGEVFVAGVSQPTFQADAGKLERWRILNASPSRFYRLSLTGHSFYAVGSDGGRFPSPRQVDELVVVPGERIEALVRPAKAGTYAVRSLAVSRGSAGMGAGTISSPDLSLALFKVSGSAEPAPLPGGLPPLDDLRTRSQPPTRNVVFSMQGGMGGATFLIDGKSFDGERVDIRIQRGTVEDWIVRNTSPMDHPFHLHVWPFQVMERSAGPVVGVEWKDTVNVPANGWVRLRIPFTNLGGKTVFHCHILDHEDLGMMAVIEVS